MAELTKTQAHRAARNAASIALAEAGSSGSSIRLYTARDGTLLAVRKLAQPCGTVRASDGRIALDQAAADDLVLASGGASYAEWCDGNGAAIASGNVTDASGNYTDASGAVVPHPAGLGAFVLTGTTGTQLFEGGIVRLTVGLIG